MKNEHHRIHLVDRTGRQLVGNLAAQIGVRCSLHLTADGLDDTSDGNDLFDCLTNLRRELEPRGWQLLCQGARTDVYPSGLSRDTGRGRRAYVLVKGQRPQPGTSVPIFDVAQPTQVGSVADQERYFREWCKSLGE